MSVLQNPQELQPKSESKLLFRQLFEKNTSVMLLIEPTSGNILEANLAATRFYGYPQAGLTGMSIQDINTFSPQQIASEMQKALHEERNFFLFQHRLASGDIREVEVYATPITIGEQCVLLSIVHDITVRTHLSRELNRVMREQEAILNSNITGIVKVRDRTIVWTNATFADMLGYAPQALIGQSTLILYPSETASQALAQAAYPVMQSGKTFRTEVRLQRQDGAPLWVKLNGALLEAHSGESIWAFADISLRKKTELALEQAERVMRASEQQMVIAQRISGTGSWSHQLDSDTIWCSAGGASLLGFAPVAGDLPLKEIDACIPEQQRLRQALLDLTCEGSGFDLEFEIRPADGSAAKVIRSVARLEPGVQGQPLIVQGFMQDITQLHELGEQIRQLAFFDPLTNLPNRRLFLDRLSQTIAADQRTHRYSALMYLDLDNFKPINDNHGHEAGDLLLAEVARRLNQCVRGTDTVARLGGDEFVVLMGGLDNDELESTRQARVVAEKIRLSLAQVYLLNTAQQHSGTSLIEHHCSASLGVVVFGRHSQNANTILQWADSAMYQAKDAGRNQVHFYDHALSSNALVK